MTRTQMVIVVAMIVCLIGVFVFSTMLIDGLEQCNPSIEPLRQLL